MPGNLLGTGDSKVRKREIVFVLMDPVVLMEETKVKKQNPDGSSGCRVRPIQGSSRLANIDCDPRRCMRDRETMI